MFSRIARRYDLMNGVMTLGLHHGWRRAAARETRDVPAGPALDLATGTGDLALALRALHPARAVIAADFALGMLDVARPKLARADPAGRIRLVAADALRLPFASGRFACVTSAFLLRNLADLEQGLREMRRVLQPGGRVVALEITQMTLPVVAPLFRLYFHGAVPRIGRLVSGDPEAYTYLPQSVTRFATPAELTRLLERAGFRDVRHRRVGLGTIAIHAGTA
jgi:demethylmenaquinone methyltransferase/2-methoxy-6-polyprenyl-1,4-benzoquinol methylase